MIVFIDLAMYLDLANAMHPWSFYHVKGAIANF